MLQSVKYLVIADDIPGIGEVHDIYKTEKEAMETFKRYKLISTDVRIYTTELNRRWEKD